MGLSSSVAFGATFSLRLGHARGLTSHRDVIGGPSRRFATPQGKANSALCTLHSALCTLHSTLCTLQAPCSNHRWGSPHPPLRGPPSPQGKANSALCTLHSTLCTLQAPCSNHRWGSPHPPLRGPPSPQGKARNCLQFRAERSEAIPAGEGYFAIFC